MARCVLNFDGWLCGDTSATTSRGYIYESARSYLYNKYRSCVLCGWGEINNYIGRAPLQIDHIDGDVSNNMIHNLRVICPNCHALTPNWGSRNASLIGKTRQGRKLHNVSVA